MNKCPGSKNMHNDDHSKAICAPDRLMITCLSTINWFSRICKFTYHALVWHLLTYDSNFGKHRSAIFLSCQYYQRII